MESKQPCGDELDADETFEIDNPCVDFCFKKVMSDKHFCCGFLCNILGFPSNEISEVRRLETQLLSFKNLGTHLTSDFLCLTRNNGTKILVEMQNNYKEVEYKAKAIVEIARVLAHWDSERLQEHVAKKAKSQGGTASSAKSFWLDIEAAYVIVVTNGPTTELYAVNQYKFLLDHNEEASASSQQQQPAPVQTPVQLQLQPSAEQFTMQPAQRLLGSIDVRVVIVSLDKFNKTEEDLITERDRYLFAFKLPARRSKSALVSKQINNLAQVTGDDSGLQHFYKILDVRNETSHFAFLKQFQEGEDFLDAIEEAAYEAGKTAGETAGKTAGETATRRNLLLELFADLRPTTNAEAMAQKFGLGKEEMRTLLNTAGITSAEDPEDIKYFTA